MNASRSVDEPTGNAVKTASNPVAKAKTNPAALALATGQAQDLTSVNRHTCQFSPELLEVLALLIRPGEHVHDPFAGPRVRLGRVCEQLGATFSGSDIEAWPGCDARVAVADARDPLSILLSRSESSRLRCPRTSAAPITPTARPHGLRSKAGGTMGSGPAERSTLLTWPAIPVALVERNCTGRITRRR